MKTGIDCKRARVCVCARACVRIFPGSLRALFGTVRGELPLEHPGAARWIAAYNIWISVVSKCKVSKALCCTCREAGDLNTTLDSLLSLRGQVQMLLPVLNIASSQETWGTVRPMEMTTLERKLIRPSF